MIMLLRIKEFVWLFLHKALKLETIISKVFKLSCQTFFGTEVFFCENRRIK